MKTRGIAAILLLPLLLVSPPLLAQQESARHPFLADKYIVGLGAFITDKSLSLRVNGMDASERIDFDESVGLDDSDSVFSGEFLWRFGEKWSLRTQYFGTDSDGGAVLTRDVEWRDNVLKAGTNVGAGFELDIARLFFGRNFWTGHNYEFGAGVGVHWMEISAFIEGEVFINDESSGFRRESVSADAPLPNIGAWYVYAPTPRWAFKARLDWLDVSIDEYSGGFANASLGVQFQAFEHFGIGMAYQYFRIDADVDKSSWNGSVDATFDGLFLSVTANW